MSRSRPWAGFTHDELSMIASWLAGGGQLCCHEAAQIRATITSSRSRQRRLASEANERFGCFIYGSKWRGSHPREYVEEQTAYYQARYLDNFLTSI